MSSDPVQPPDNPLTASRRPPREVWNDIVSTLNTGWHEPDVEAMQVQLACFAAHYLKDANPAWVMAIAPSGSAKTVMLEALKGVSRYHMIDQVTSTTFISGRIEDDTRLTAKERAAKVSRRTAQLTQAKHNGGRRPESSSFLHRMGDDGVVAIADFSTILAMRDEARSNIFAQMRRIYDGRLHREFGTAEQLEDREWEGRVTMMVAVTPEVDRYGRMFSSLGDRFLRVRWPRAGGAAAMCASARQTRSSAEGLRKLVQELIGGYELRVPPVTPEIPDPVLRRTGNLTELVCFARTYVNRVREEPDGEVYPESNTRLPQQLCQMARGWAALMGKAAVDEEEERLVRRVAFDCVPPARKAVIDDIRGGPSAYSVMVSAGAVSVAKDDLVELGLIVKGDEMSVRKMSFTEFARDLLREAGL